MLMATEKYHMKTSRLQWVRICNLTRVDTGVKTWLAPPESKAAKATTAGTLLKIFRHIVRFTSK